jgi:DNA polymerase-3 subunit delta'
MKYPWQEKQWQQIWSAFQAGRLPHGLLLSGMAGTGKYDFALHLAQALLCQQIGTNGEPCGKCHACRMALTSAHPNIYLVAPEKEGHAIKVDQIRELAEFVQQSSMQQGLRIAIINPAHSMNMNAANALLKTLEEPAQGAVIILVTDQIGSILPTIKSRCQRMLFPRPEQETALRWLQLQSNTSGMSCEQALRLAHGAPLAALSAAQQDILPLRTELFQALTDLARKKADPLTLAAKWQKTDPVQWLDLLAGWIADLLRLQTGADLTQLHNQDFTEALQATAAHIPAARNQRILQQAVKMRGQLSGGINYNKQLLMESLLIHWAG